MRLWRLVKIFDFQRIVELAKLLDPAGEGTRRVLHEIKTNPEKWDLNEEEKQAAVHLIRELLKRIENWPAEEEK